MVLGNLRERKVKTKKKPKKKFDPIKVKDTLPNKPSELLLLAIKDLEKVEKSKRLIVDMGHWVSPHAGGYEIPKGKCAVCLAGAVLVRSLGVTTSNGGFTPEDFNKNICGKARALDAFRSGFVGGGLFFMGLKRPSWIPAHIQVTRYTDDPKAFKAQMREIAKNLSEVGL